MANIWRGVLRWLQKSLAAPWVMLAISLGAAAWQVTNPDSPIPLLVTALAVTGTFISVQRLLKGSRVASLLMAVLALATIAWQFLDPESDMASVVMLFAFAATFITVQPWLSNPKVAPWMCAAITLLASVWLLWDARNTFASLLLVGAMVLMYLANINKWLKLALAFIPLVVVLPLAAKDNLGLGMVFIAVFLNITLALGLNLVVGFAGLLDLGYIAFFAGGAYLYAFFASTQAAEVFKSHASLFPFGGWWFWAALAATTLFAALLGTLLGLPVLRLRGDYLAIVTLGFGEIIQKLAKNLDKPINFTNGTKGIDSIMPPSLFGWQLNKSTHFYFLAMAIALVTLIIMTRIEKSRIGRAWAAMREDDTAARAMGINLTRMKLLAFSTGAAFAGASGALYAVKQQFINPDTFTFTESVGIVSMIILGGLGSIPGAIIGAVSVTLIRMQILQHLSDWLHKFHLPNAIDLVKYQPLMFGLVLILMMLYRQEGLLPIKRKPEDIAAIEAAPDPLPQAAGAPGKQVQS